MALPLVPTAPMEWRALGRLQVHGRAAPRRPARPLLGRSSCPAAAVALGGRPRGAPPEREPDARAVPPPDVAYWRALPESVRSSLLADWKPRLQPYCSDEDVWFRLADRSDLESVQAFIARVLPGAIDRFAAKRMDPPPDAVVTPGAPAWDRLVVEFHGGPGARVWAEVQELSKYPDALDEVLALWREGFDEWLADRARRSPQPPWTSSNVRSAWVRIDCLSGDWVRAPTATIRARPAAPSASGAARPRQQQHVPSGRTPDAGRDTMTISDSLSPPCSCHCAHEVRTSRAGCRGFESRLPLHCPQKIGVARRRRGWPPACRPHMRRQAEVGRSAIIRATMAASSPTPNRVDDLRVRRKCVPTK